MSSRPQLHIEVLCAPEVERGEYESVQQQVCAWIKKRFSSLPLGCTIEEISGFDYADMIQRVQASDCSPPRESKTYVMIKEVDLIVHCFTFEDQSNTAPPNGEQSQETSSAAMTSTRLPCMTHDSHWDGLHYAEGFKSLLLNEVLGLLDLFRDGKLNATLHNYNRLVLLHGPPGSGKTTLCRALAQKLAIRQSAIYTTSYLLEINANAFHSKFFGESGKEIAKLFQRIADLAEDPEVMVCVLIDEIETIAGSRSRAHATSEVGDALRATNQLLTALDKMKRYTNVVIFTTSNLADILDEAFASRVDILENIPPPSTSARYEILRSSLNDLHVCHKIVGDNELEPDPESQLRQNVLVFADYSFEVEELFPRYALACADAVARPGGHVERLLVISQKCHDFSGRLLRRLPSRAIAKKASTGPVPILEAMAALSRLVDVECQRSARQVVVPPNGIAA